MSRARVNFAWFLRGIAKRLNERANRIDPIRLDVHVDDPFCAGSRRMAHEAIKRAMAARART